MWRDQSLRHWLRATYNHENKRDKKENMQRDQLCFLSSRQTQQHEKKRIILFLKPFQKKKILCKWMTFTPIFKRFREYILLTLKKLQGNYIKYLLYFTFSILSHGLEPSSS